MKPDICAWMKPMGYAGVALMSLMTTSCFYVWQEPIRYGEAGPGVRQPAPAPGTLDELQAQRDRGGNVETKPPAAEPKRDALPPARDPDPEPAPTPPRQEASSIPVARKVPGRDGFVFSPYNNKMIDVKGFPKGMKVLDPHFDPSEKKYFRVP